MVYAPKDRTLKYGCGEYREEMILAALKKRLSSGELSDEERKELEQDIKKLEVKMGL